MRRSFQLRIENVSIGQDGRVCWTVRLGLASARLAALIQGLDPSHAEKDAWYPGIGKSPVKGGSALVDKVCVGASPVTES